MRFGEGLEWLLSLGTGGIGLWGMEGRGMGFIGDAVMRWIESGD